MSIAEQNEAIFKVAKNVRLFAGLDRAQLIDLLSRADKCAIPENKIFFDEGDVGESFYILFIGKVVIERMRDGRWIELATLKSGDSFGEMTLIDERRRTARVRALNDCVALHFSLPRIKAHPDLASALLLNIAKVMVSRLKTSNSAVVELMTKVAKIEGEEAGEPPSASKSSPDAPTETREWWLETIISG
jgi:CRP-like cAMP-binding protein